MIYETLKKIHYTVPLEVEDIYRSRYNAPFTKHFPFDIKQLNRKNKYPAFLCYTEELLLLIEKIYKNYEKFLYKVNSVPPVVLHQFALACIVDEVKATNDIEGVYSTRRELKEVLDGLSEKSQFSSIVNKYHNLINKEKFLFDTPYNIRKFYDNFAHKEVIAANPKNRLDGECFRKEIVEITTPTGKIIHKGLYPENIIIKYLNIALNVLNDENIPSLIRFAIFHFLFEYIHPFYDGNGRTGRFITSYYISQHFHYIIALRLSVIIKKHRKKYYDLFNSTEEEVNRGDLTPFVYGFIQIISDTFDDVIEILDRKMAQLVKYKEKLFNIIPSDELNQNLYFILLQASLFYGQGVSMQDLMKITGKSRNTIKSRLLSMPKDHIIKRNAKTHYYKLNMLLFNDKKQNPRR